MRLGSDGLEIADLSGAVHGGTIKGSGELRNNGGSGLLSAQLSVAGIDIAKALNSRLSRAPAQFPSASPPPAKASTRWSPGSADRAVPGPPTSRSRLRAPTRFPRSSAPRMRSAAAIDAAAVARIVPSLVSTGALRAGSVEAAFTVAGGQVRMPPVVLQADGARLTADVRIDLTRPEIRATAISPLDAGLDALVGSEPAVRFALTGLPGAYVRTLDTAPMAQFLIQRALEKEQARVEAMQAVLLEQQRLRRETRYYLARAAAREAAARLPVSRGSRALQREAEERARARRPRNRLVRKPRPNAWPMRPRPNVLPTKQQRNSPPRKPKRRHVRPPRPNASRRRRPAEREASRRRRRRRGGKGTCGRAGSASAAEAAERARIRGGAQGGCP